ncbi:MAG: carotenoid 1,2-hydratase [Pseudomonadota bacterium]
MHIPRHSPLRRALLLSSLGGTLMPALALPPAQLRFPRDLGSHPDFRTEWWYVTGHAQAGAREFGFQVTFFRSRIDATQAMRSGFAAKHLVFAHAAITDVQGHKLWHDQRTARMSGQPSTDLASASEADTAIALRDWSLVRQNGRYLATVRAADFGMQLQFNETQAMVLQGDQGLSRKGPDAAQASYYYSLPQLQVQGALTLQGQRHTVTGTAWLDHEWSQALLDTRAVGWDWIGMNLSDGSALTAYRLRTATGDTLWDGGSFRHPRSGLFVFRQGEVVFKPLRHWTSPATGTRYPVEWRVQTPADFYTVKAVVDAQELDSRASTGAIYWEGLSRLYDSHDRLVGQGYLEMTGHGQALRL